MCEKTQNQTRTTEKRDPDRSSSSSTFMFFRTRSTVDRSSRNTMSQRATVPTVWNKSWPRMRRRTFGALIAPASAACSAA
eukprot:6716832-Prymnesium_polylepis.1